MTIDINQTISVIVGILSGLGIKSFFDKYMAKKAENLATKEDIKELTRLSEEIKSEFINKQHHEKQLYNIKLDTINDSLDFIDKYISWHTIDSGITPVREDLSEQEMTVIARHCYNRLILTCQNEELINCFNQICFDNDANIFELYVIFRNLARKELGLGEPSLDKNNVFYSIVSTKDLSELEDREER